MIGTNKRKFEIHKRYGNVISGETRERDGKKSKSKQTNQLDQTYILVIEDRTPRHKMLTTSCHVLTYDHHPSPSTVGVRETVLGVGEATDRVLYDEVGPGLRAYGVVGPRLGYCCLGACIESHTEDDCGGVSLRGCWESLTCPTGVSERSPP